MSEEATADEAMASEELESQQTENLAKKFRLIPGEEIHLTKKPSTFAFVGMYGLGALVLGLHFLFGALSHMNVAPSRVSLMQNAPRMFCITSNPVIIFLGSNTVFVCNN